MALRAHSLSPQHLAPVPMRGGPSASCSPSAPLRAPSCIARRRPCRGPNPQTCQGAPPARQLSCRASVDVAAPVEPRVSVEDFHKAGGSEVHFLQMQAQKEAHGQEPISSQVRQSTRGLASVRCGRLPLLVGGSGFR